MSDNYICVIPQDPRHVPAALAELEAVMAALMPQAEAIEVEVDQGIAFRDCGGNFQSVRCPTCRAELGIDEWQELMDADFSDGEQGFRLVAVPLPGCGHVHALNDLEYDFRQGFSRFMIAAMNPDRKDLDAVEVQRLERAMGCAVTIIYQHI